MQAARVLVVIVARMIYERTKRTLLVDVHLSTSGLVHRADEHGSRTTNPPQIRVRRL